MDPQILELGVPILGICYGFQTLAHALGGQVDNSGKREYGATDLKLKTSGVLLGEQPAEQICWMSHGDQVVKAPEGFEVLASTETTPVAAFESVEKKIFGVQWHPEVKHSEFGQKVLENFLYQGAGLEPNWSSGNVIAEQVEKIQAQVGNSKVICGLSGGVDSAVAAALVHKAVGDQLTAVFVDHGLLRKGEAEQVERDYVEATGIKLKVVNAEEQFLEALSGISDPEQKRKIIGREFIRSFEQAERELIAEAKKKTKRWVFWFRGLYIQMLWKAEEGQPLESKATTTLVAYQRIWSLNLLSHFELCSKMRLELLAESLDFQSQS